MSPTSTALSAPGKVFLAGGYLVLDRTYTALVFGLSARIHIRVDDIDTTAGLHLSEIVVQSPQFRDATWNYGYRQTDDHGGIQVTQLQGASPISRNPFVETTLAYTLTYISTLTTSVLKPSKVTILADNDYYSQPTPASTAPPSATRFTDFAVRLSDAHKTGLGSSAALVTSLTGALLTHYLPATSFSLSSAAGKSILHNLAQAAHCAAQGKVGSGFDVAVAVYGTCKYRRFSPAILSSLGEAGSPDFAVRVKAVVENVGLEKAWDTECEKGVVTIPAGMALVMCDVDCGSHTPSMVKKVLEWRKADPEGSTTLMNTLQACNDVLEQKLAQGSMKELEQAFADIRTQIREMGDRSGVPIEPAEQTELLDAVTAQVDGVAGGVVPGAGGYDAIVLLVKDDAQTTADLETFLAKWSKEKGSNVKLLKTKGELEGARVEDASAYEGAFA